MYILTDKARTIETGRRAVNQILENDGALYVLGNVLNRGIIDNPEAEAIFASVQDLARIVHLLYGVQGGFLEDLLRDADLDRELPAAIMAVDPEKSSEDEWQFKEIIPVGEDIWLLVR